MSRSMKEKEKSIEKMRKGEKRKKRMKTRGEHGCARLHALPRNDVTKPIDAAGEVLKSTTIESKGGMLGKIKFKLFGR